MKTISDLELSLKKLKEIQKELMDSPAIFGGEVFEELSSISTKVSRKINELKEIEKDK